MELTHQDEVVSKNEIVFKSLSKNLYVETVSTTSEVKSYTEDIMYALTMPNTINFKNSKKYTQLIQNPDLKPVHKLSKTVYQIYEEEL